MNWALSWHDNQPCFLVLFPAFLRTHQVCSTTSHGSSWFLGTPQDGRFQPLRAVWNTKDCGLAALKYREGASLPISPSVLIGRILLLVVLLGVFISRGLTQGLGMRPGESGCDGSSRCPRSVICFVCLSHSFEGSDTDFHNAQSGNPAYFGSRGSCVGAGVFGQR